LFGVSPTEPLVFVAAAGVLGSVAIVANWIPARTATKADPLQAFRGLNVATNEVTCSFAALGDHRRHRGPSAAGLSEDAAAGVNGGRPSSALA
jgi:hypothetical protein